MYDFIRQYSKIWKITSEKPIFFISAFCLMLLGFLNKYILIALLFSLLDFINSYVEMKFKIDLLFDFALIGVILLSYYDHLNLSFLVIMFFLINRVINGKFEKRHLLKVPVFFAIAFISAAAGFIALNLLGPILFLLRFAFEYSIELLIFGKITLNRIPRRILHFVAAIVFFGFFGKAYW